MNENVEMMPLGLNILVVPYSENPYTSKNENKGLVTSAERTFNNDNGELEQLKRNTVCGKVIEVGEAVKFVKVGDDIIYHIGIGRPIYFLDTLFMSVPENNVYAVINSGLKERLKNG